MRLVKLSANKKTFKTVTFNPSGLSFVVAKQKNPGISDEGKTYNGVGKSLLVRIIHFCLGGSKDSYKSFCSKLPGWEFNLIILVKKKEILIKRKTDEPNKIFIGEKEYTVDKFNEYIATITFEIPENTQFLSFRSLIPFFIRPNKASYNDCKKPGKSTTEFQTMFYNAFLLGLDYTIAFKKYHIRKDQERIQDLEKNFKNDSLLKDFFTGNKDVELTIIDLDERIKKLNGDLKKFEVAEDYYEVQKEANEIERELFKIKNEIILIQNNLSNIEKNIGLVPSMDLSAIESVYSEVKIFFSDNLKKSISEVDEFYKRLIAGRNKRLQEMKNQYLAEISAKTNDSNDLAKKLDYKMKYLGDHQALDLFLSLSQRISEYKLEKEKLVNYKDLQKEYKSQERLRSKDILNLATDTDEYLKQNEKHINGIRDYFRNLAKEFYPNNPAGLSVKPNEGENQLLYNIEPKIDSDASDGINNVKIFCYDLTLLHKGKNHKMEFLFHDSRLFDGIDERQKTKLFQIAWKIFSKSGNQYIATVNQNQLEEIRKILPEQEFDNIITKNTILTLTDESVEGKLLGVKVDISDN
jgi:uncharacterized protein YydD (DUF2326 family)